MGYSERSTVKLLGEHPKVNYVMTPKSLMLDDRLTSDAFRVGVYLLSLKDGREVNQRQITAALGWPTNSIRVSKAIKNLVGRGWLMHNRYTSGKRTYKHEYVLNRARRVYAEKSSAVDLDTTERGSAEKSSSLYAEDSSAPPKDQKKTDDHESHRVDDLSQPDGWTRCPECGYPRQAHGHTDDGRMYCPQTTVMVPDDAPPF